MGARYHVSRFRSPTPSFFEKCRRKVRGKCAEVRGRCLRRASSKSARAACGPHLRKVSSEGVFYRCAEGAWEVRRKRLYFSRCAHRVFTLVDLCSSSVYASQFAPLGCLRFSIYTYRDAPLECLRCSICTSRVCTLLEMHPSSVRAPRFVPFEWLLFPICTSRVFTLLDLYPSGVYASRFVSFERLHFSICLSRVVTLLDTYLSSGYTYRGAPHRVFTLFDLHPSSIHASRFLPL